MDIRKDAQNFLDREDCERGSSLFDGENQCFRE